MLQLESICRSVGHGLTWPDNWVASILFFISRLCNRARKNKSLGETLILEGVYEIHCPIVFWL
jgi:hypothetical protein